ncbi:type II toxin-antitoxin system HicB family antitoxin [Longimicrobium terrae]|uniref:Putative RNase H-like HicB family nuclease n=1 Tax=Longimicrobium terrae TaxID=1639882 RepID=A0A841H4U0_9BACT|nr:type II toxin-antitoxin system HicB family antitoxin [Longimicrobium terrae]MBB4638755.1 putative RNase H-like HicB family nuclease [Longimicrobium terrae]MBB6072994.1 putative RNase H-like HicB family nuclease [Longimicrobium terrae]
MELQVTAIFQQVPEGWIAWAQEIPGAMTQGDTLDEARENLIDAVQLLVLTRREMDDELHAGMPMIREQLSIRIE